MRTPEELQKVLLDNFEIFFSYGLCFYFKSLYDYDLIKGIELSYLRDKMRSDLNYIKDYYFLGIKGDPEPRIKWIKENIV